MYKKFRSKDFKEEFQEKDSYKYDEHLEKSKIMYEDTKKTYKI